MELGEAGGVTRPVFAQGGPVKKPQGFADGGTASADLTNKELQAQLIALDAPAAPVEEPLDQEQTESRNILDRLTATPFTKEGERSIFGSALAGIPGAVESAIGYGKDVVTAPSPSAKLLADIFVTGGEMKQSAEEDPLGYLGETLPPFAQVNALNQVDELNKQANEARRNGNEEEAKRLEKFITVTALGAFPFIKGGVRPNVTSGKGALKITGPETTSKNMLDELSGKSVTDPLALEAPVPRPEAPAPTLAPEVGEALKMLDEVDNLSNPKSFSKWGIQSDPVKVFDEFGQLSDVVDGPEYALIEKVYVDPSERGQGAARNLLREALVEIQEKHPQLPIKLAASSLEKATDLDRLVGFYESEGFTSLPVESGMDFIPMEYTGGKIDAPSTQSAKMLDEVDAVNAPRLELPEIGRPVRASEYTPAEFKAITRNMYNHQADVTTPAEMVARAERIEPSFQTAIRNITDDLGLIKSETFGVKQVKSLENKLKRGYELGTVTDPIRTRILINTAQEADEVVDRITQIMPLQDRGVQQHTTSGYFDRKLNVMYTDANGEKLLGEIQITTPEMLEAVESTGHRLYEVERALTERYGAIIPTTHIRRFENMQRAQKELYQGVAERVDPSIVNSIQIKPKKDLVDTPTTPTAQKKLVTETQREAWRKANKGDFRQEQTPELALAAEKLGNGKITIADYAKEVKRLRPIEPLTSVPKISSFEEIASALDKNKVDKGLIGLDKEIADGTPVGSRLDIPAYNNYDTWVVSVHEGTGVSGKSLGYGKVAVLDNVSFNSNPKAAYGVATGNKDKAPFARMNGKWRNVDPEAARKQAEEYLTDPDWVQVGMNPYRHSFFYDKATGQPLASADEVIQIGPLVLARNSKTRPLESSEHAIKNPKKGQPTHFKKGGAIERVYNEQTYI